ncbi:MAG: heavy metal-responsive transcriptional regulator [Pyrinomonadaceae bacterium]
MRNAFDFAEAAAEARAAGGRALKIGEVSKLSGIGVEALRFYEKSGLLDRPGRTYSGYRVYDESVLERLEFVKKAQVLGFTLDEIKELIAHKQNGQSPCKEVRAIVRERLEELNERIEQLISYRDELKAALKKWDRTGQADGHVCGLIETSHIEHKVSSRKVGRRK